MDVLDDQSWVAVKDIVGTLWAHTPILNFTPFKPAFFCTYDFKLWWQTYLVTFINDAARKMTQLTVAFDVLQGKGTKCKEIHIKEIQAFQNFFKVVYLPNDLRRTISDAARELKEKIIEKIPQLKIPSYAKDKYFYALYFGKIKFPPLPTSPLALAFRPSFPDWWYISWSNVQNAYKKKADRVVPTKYWLHTYSGFLHIDLRYVRELVVVPKGNRSWKILFLSQFISHCYLTWFFFSCTCATGGCPQAKSCCC